MCFSILFHFYYVKSESIVIIDSFVIIIKMIALIFYYSNCFFTYCVYTMIFDNQSLLFQANEYHMVPIQILVISSRFDMFKSIYLISSP